MTKLQQGVSHTDNFVSITCYTNSVSKQNGDRKGNVSS